MEARLTIQPCDSRRSGIAACVRRKSPRRLPPGCRSRCLAGRSSTRPAMPTPAELTSTSSRPKRSRCSATSRAQSFSSATSAATAVAPSSAAAACTFSGRREASVSPKPSSRSMRAIARPIPDEPPVTSAALSTVRTVDRVEAPALTGLTVGGGCAAKYSAARLEELLRGFVPAEAENLLVGLDPADDAAVYKLDDERALVFTVDFFPPLVDDPDDFGTIAATNALNDVFAMGGVPLLALSVAALPEELPIEVVRAIFDGAERQVRAAGALLAGGHTIRDSEPKYGLAVVGTVSPDGLWPKAGARPGDALYLTKPLGTALVLGGAKRGLADATEAVRWMRTLNRDAADRLRP